MVVLSELCEGSSSSSSTQAHRYDVFLSFRGVDTRHGFTNHLYNALMHANISTFFDDEEIETGEDLKPELEYAIKSSRASVIVLSKNYATSTWCLDELVLILEQRMKSNHIVIPIFYHVEPTNVRKQQSSFGDAMAKHKQKMEVETNSTKRNQWVQKIELWNKALREVADLKGKDANGRQEVELIDEIVKDIFRRLCVSSRFPLPQLIGMENSIELVTSWLKDATSHTTDILTILGMGGIGKTSLAKYVYVLHSHEFDNSSFIADINRRCYTKYNGMIDVQKQLYNDISKPSSVQVHDVSVYTSMIENALARKKVFLVLDDIGSIDQLDALLGSKGFHPGSKILITTKDAWLTQSSLPFKTNIKPNYTEHKLRGLSTIEARKLLCFHAFMCNKPKAGYEEVSEKLVKYCDGHPMALKVLGRSLHNRDVTYWEGYIDTLKKENNSPINNVLRMSFDSLSSENDKDLFKHISCFFVGMDKNDTLTILEACDIETKTGITNLIDKCLLNIGWYNELTMHQLVQEMGRFVVREESLSCPWERSRLWGHESFRVLNQEMGTKNVLGLTLDMKILENKRIRGSLELKTDALSMMDRLMLLQLNYVQTNGSYEKFPKELRWLCMHGFPWKSIPSDLPMENVVALDMSHSNIESFGIFYSYPQRLHKRLKKLIGSCSDDKRLLGSLKILNLSFCEQLRRLGGFDHLPKLEKLILNCCTSLLEVCESIEECVELVHADLSYCNKLGKLPRIIGMLKKVNTLLLEGCALGESRIKVNNIGINSITSSSTIVGAMPSYSKFFAISLPRYLVSLSLENNNLSTESFPVDFSCLTMLKELHLDENPIVSLPFCVRSLPRLQILGMSNCNMLTTIENPPPTLKYLSLYFGSSCNRLLRKVVFDPQMSPLMFIFGSEMFSTSSFEFEGIVKIQPVADVEEKVLHCLGWTNLDFLIGMCVGAYLDDRREESEIQMYYEFGIFSTIYWSKEMPNWITDRSMGSSISFTIPSSPNNLTGLNCCCMVTSPFTEDVHLEVPLMKITNITKNLTWIYQHYVGSVLDVGGKSLMLLSHWMFGMNEMECGDHVTITVTIRENPDVIGNAVAKECGVSFVYDNESKDEEEDALGYYKSWNHIIGGDLTAFQTTTGEYILSKWRILAPYMDLGMCGDGTLFKDEQVHFRALSQRKSNILEDGP
ncbi:disease resistance protein RPV1 isoform X1 [Lactuca sativa]|uniref:disease resistance protein RPV1 isoform X1 n=1 Tax=Lactuca sativa TaxID=4236 RepID=UPI000CBBF88D|nr:disease resistance protein RPV1 isoform X1 [Lactuca sativa]